MTVGMSDAAHTARCAVNVVVVCPVHNRRDLTLQCLETIFASSLHDDDLTVGLHVIIVDDDSTDGTAAAIHGRFPQVQIMRGDGNLYYTAGTNRGLAAALAHEPDFVLAINDDQRFRPDAIHRMVRCAVRFPRAVVGALLVRWDDTDRVFQTDPQWDIRFGGWHHWQQLSVRDVPDRPWVVQLIVGNCVLFPTAAIREVGLMDERKLPMYGDAEYTPRMRRRGWQLLVEPAAVVECQPNAVSPDIRHLHMAGRYQHLWGNRRSPYNLRSIATGLLRGAPTRTAGACAMIVFLARLAAKAVGCAGRWPNYEPDRARWQRKLPGS